MKINTFGIFCCLFLNLTAWRSLASPVPGDTSRQKKCSFSPDSVAAGKGDFTGCRFSLSNFSRPTFDRRVSFDQVVFTRLAFFDEPIADLGISFRAARFEQGFYLSRMALFLETHFDGSVFMKESRLERVSCKKLLSFSNCSFTGKISFVDDEFDRVDLSHLQLTDQTQLSFHNTHADVLDFSFDSKIYNEIRLIDAFDSNSDLDGNGSGRVARPCLVNFYRSDISKFYLDYKNFKLYFPKYHDESSNVDSTEITPYEKQIIYENLLSNFKAHDQAEDRQLLDIEYQTFKFNVEGHHFYRWLDRWWWNFGYDKEYIFAWAFGLVFFFSFINSFLLDILRTNVYTMKGIPERIPGFVPLRNLPSVGLNCSIALRRFWYALVYTAALFFLLSLELKNFKFQHVLGTIYLVLIYTSGVVCLAYMANFVLQK